jgi:hypothetical protein
MQRIADQRPEAALQRQVQAWGNGSEWVGQLRAWQRVADGRGVGGKRQNLTPNQPRGESAEGLLDAYAGGSGSFGSAVQRIGNETNVGEEGKIKHILGFGNTPEQQLEALEQSADPIFWYGNTAKTDEETEITASASFLERRKADWRAELQHRANQAIHIPAPKNLQPWETFQRGISAMAPNEQQIQAPWFMNQHFGYQLQNANNQQDMQQIEQGLANPDAYDPQELLGSSYQRDTNFLFSQDMKGHCAYVDGNSTVNNFNGWVNDVLRVTHGGAELRVRISFVGGLSMAVLIRGTVLASPAVPWGLNAGTVLTMQGTASNGTLRIDDAASNNTLHTVPNGWAGNLESWSYYQSMTVPNEALGIGVNNSDLPRARNRDLGKNLDDNTFNTIGTQYGQPNDPRSMRNTLGTWRTRLNFSDVGSDIKVAPYRRLGGDGIFKEAHHQNPGAYQNQIQPANNVDVNNVDWYYNQANSNPDRFVGGRSNSTKLYMGAATMLFHEGRLSLAEAMDVLAFVIADMVVSGEHSMPECMTTVAMVAGSSEPWTGTSVNLQNATSALKTWFKLVDDQTKNAMYVDARQKLFILLATIPPDSKLLKVFVILDKMLYNG